MNSVNAQNTFFDALSQSNATVKQSGLYDSSASSFQSTLKKEMKSDRPSLSKPSSDKDSSSVNRHSASESDNSAKARLKSKKEKSYEKTKEEKTTHNEPRHADVEKRSANTAKKTEESANDRDVVTAPEEEDFSRETNAEQKIAETALVEDESVEDTEENIGEDTTFTPDMFGMFQTVEEEVVAVLNEGIELSESIPEDNMEIGIGTETETSAGKSELVQDSNTAAAYAKSVKADAPQTQTQAQTQTQTQAENNDFAAALSGTETKFAGSAAGTVDSSADNQKSQFLKTGIPLNAESDFKLTNVRLEKLSPELNDNTEENPQDILKNLLGRSRNLNVKNSANLSLGNQNEAYGLKSQIEGFHSQNMKDLNGNFLSGSSKLAQQGFNGMLDSVKSHGAQISSGTPKLDALNLAGQTQDGTASKTLMSSPAQQLSYAGGTSANAALVGELISRMQGMLRGSNLDKGSKLTMDFESTALGQVNLSVQQKGDAISVNIQLNSDSSKDQLMQQRDDLASQLRMMGYKDVALDISSGRERRDDAHSKNRNAKNKGNDDIQNVRLAGDDNADRARVLSGELV